MLDTLKSNKGMAAQVASRLQHEAAVAEFMASESAKARRGRKQAEKRSIATVKLGKERDDKRRVSMMTIEDGQTKITVKKVKTTIDKMITAGQMPKRMKQHVDAFSILVADGYGVATAIGHDSSNRLTCSYEPMSGSGFGSKTPSDRQLDGLTAYRQMHSRIPAEMMQTFMQIIGEETGNMRVERRNLAQIGESNGFTHRQASAAGAMEILAVCFLIAHFMREKGLAGA